MSDNGKYLLKNAMTISLDGLVISNLTGKNLLIKIPQKGEKAGITINKIWG